MKPFLNQSQISVAFCWNPLSAPRTQNALLMSSFNVSMLIIFLTSFRAKPFLNYKLIIAPIFQNVNSFFKKI